VPNVADWDGPQALDRRYVANMVGVGRSGPTAMREVARTLHHLTVAG
jgi:hypothetical protein